MFYIFGFYKFCKIFKPGKYKKDFLKFLISNNIKGTIIFSKEGLNGTLSGSQINLFKTKKKIKSTLKIKKFDSENYAINKFQPFPKAKIKIKEEVVPIGFKVSSVEKLKKQTEPKNWNKLLKDKNTKIIDTRKSFEYDVGTFQGAENPNIKNFRDFPKYLKNIPKKTKIAMFCTGGIRCEKASIYLKRNGYKNIFLLKGGILNYLNKIDKSKSMWKGECFVFDNRVSVKHKLKIGNYSICGGCRMPVSFKEKKSKKYNEGITCPRCYDKLSVLQKERFSMRQKQILRAKKLGNKYFFQKEFN
tara:strand:- start:1025 stop:1930 length:906 start_codon:yes stop_codon:yes gene_type:complete